MDTAKIYKTASEITAQEVDSIVLTWSAQDKKEYESLVRLGDSKQLAYATVLHDNRPKQMSELMRIGYEG